MSHLLKGKKEKEAKTFHSLKKERGWGYSPRKEGNGSQDMSRPGGGASLLSLLRKEGKERKEQFPLKTGNKKKKKRKAYLHGEEKKEEETVKRYITKIGQGTFFHVEREGKEGSPLSSV